MAESSNWERAEMERSLQRSHERQMVDERKKRRQLVAALSQERHAALHKSREWHRHRMHERGFEAKAESDTRKQQLALRRETFQESAKAIPRAQQNNEKVRSQMAKLHAHRTALVAARTAERQRAERERDDETAARINATRTRAQLARVRQAERVRSSCANDVKEREAVVDHMRELQITHEDERDQLRKQVVDANSGQREGIARMLSPGKVRDFKAQEQARKAQRAMRHKAERESFRHSFDTAWRNEEERRRQIHDSVRRAALGGYGDRRLTAYSSYMHSGTSHYSQSREDGPHHGFKHDLPSARAPSGRWLREYAQAYVQESRRCGSAVSV